MLGRAGWILLCMGLAVACGVAAASTLGAWRASRVPPAPPRGKIQLEVLNGCGQRGIADQAARTLVKMGYDVVRTGNAAEFNHARSMVIDRSGQEGRAAEVARELGCRETRRELRPQAYLDVTVIVGSDFGSLPGVAAMKDADRDAR